MTLQKVCLKSLGILDIAWELLWELHTLDNDFKAKCVTSARTALLSENAELWRAMNFVLMELRIPQWGELLILILGSQFQKDTTGLFWIGRSKDCSPSSLLLHQRKFLQRSAWSARDKPLSRATGTKPKSTTATVLDSATSPNPAMTVCFSPPIHPQSLTHTPRLKFKGMYKDEENSRVNTNSEVQKEFSCSATFK